MHLVVRSLFAVGEAGNFPASIKTVAEWFPKRERALATAIFNSGSNGGLAVAAPVVPTLMVGFGTQEGWKAAFIITGASGLVWLIFCSGFTIRRANGAACRKRNTTIDGGRRNRRGSANRDKTTKVSWFRLFGYRQLWAFFAGKFMTDGIWWFYLFWLPDYLTKQFGMKTAEVRIPTFMVFGVSIGGKYLRQAAYR